MSELNPEVMTTGHGGPHTEDQTFVHKKISQIIGFSYPFDVTVEQIKAELKLLYGDSAELQDLLGQIDDVLQQSNKSKEDETMVDESEAEQYQAPNREVQDIFAVDIDTEMNLVEKIFRYRDHLVDMRQLQSILPEEEHKKCMKDKTMPRQTVVSPLYVVQPVT